MPRKTLDGAKLAGDVSRLLAADMASPPEERPSLMDAVRAFAGYIETRANLGWPDSMIAALLTEAGYPIDAATFRSYCKRLREAGLLAPRPTSGRAVTRSRMTSDSSLPTEPSLRTVPPRTERMPGAAAGPAGTTVRPAITATKPPAADATPRAPPDSTPERAPPPHANYRIDPAKLPPDRA